MLPGRLYTIDDILAMIRRRTWVIAAPVVLLGLATGAILDRLPDRYRSSTLIMVVPQRVPESYVRATVTTRIEDRLQSISQQLLSRTRLERIIRDYGLYERARQTAPMEDVVERMRADIQVQVVKGDAFRLSYVADVPVIAQKVTERLASLLIEESLRDREVLAEATNEFLETQLEDARRRLVEQEKQVEQYRERNSGALPSQLQSNLQVVQNLQTQLQGVVDSTNRDRDRRLVLERTVMEIESAATVPAPAPGEAAVEGSPEAKLAAVRQSLASMETRLKPQHPDIISAKMLIRDLEAEVAARAQAVPGLKPLPPIQSIDPAQRKRVESLKAEMLMIDLQIADKEQRRRKLADQIGQYDQRIAAVPARESELSSLTRDYETLQKVYTDLLSKREQSKVAANLERRQIGEHFSVLDPARLPEKPFSPNRPLLLLAGLGAGLGLGLALAGWLEFRDTSLRSETDISAALQLPMLAVVPVIRTARERRRRRLRLIAVSLTASTLALMVAFLVWKLSGIAV
jgi:polysaccharide chain length determinant protein (PEP-CTERM system associated)